MIEGTVLKEAAIPLDTVDAVILQIKGDPNCHRSNCGGKGYVGVRVNPGQQPTVLLCSCGKWVETDWARMMKRYEELSAIVKGAHDNIHQSQIGLSWHLQALGKRMEEQEQRRLSARVKKAWRWMVVGLKMVTEKKVDEPITAPVPVTGEVKA